jgi:hypothetical protein
MGVVSTFGQGPLESVFVMSKLLYGFYGYTHVKYAGPVVLVGQGGQLQPNFFIMSEANPSFYPECPFKYN